VDVEEKEFTLRIKDRLQFKSHIIDKDREMEVEVLFLNVRFLTSLNKIKTVANMPYGQE
jgi:hypothetical protein